MSGLDSTRILSSPFYCESLVAKHGGSAQHGAIRGLSWPVVPAPAGMGVCAISEQQRCELASDRNSILRQERAVKRIWEM